MHIPYGSYIIISFSPYDYLVRRESYIIVRRKTGNFRQKNSYSRGLNEKVDKTCC